MTEHTSHPGPAAQGGPSMPMPNGPMGKQELAAGNVSPTGFFTGFEISYPEYELVTPQTLQTMTLRSMNVSEEETLKSSLVTPKKIPAHINDIIWKCLVKKPNGMNTKADFLNMITLRDRDALLYALYHITYKDVHNYDVRCQSSSCKNTYPITFEISNIFKMKAYEGEPMDLLGKRVAVPLVLAKDATAIIRQPTLADEEELLNDMLFENDSNMDIATEMSIVEAFQLRGESREPVDVTGRANIFPAYSSLPASDRKLIDKAYFENFGKYAVSLDITSTCEKCGFKNEGVLDLFQQMFRTMHE